MDEYCKEHKRMAIKCIRELPEDVGDGCLAQRAEIFRLMKRDVPKSRRKLSGRTAEELLRIIRGK